MSDLAVRPVWNAYYDAASVKLALVGLTRRTTFLSLVKKLFSNVLAVAVYLVAGYA